MWSLVLKVSVRLTKKRLEKCLLDLAVRVIDDMRLRNTSFKQWILSSIQIWNHISLVFCTLISKKCWKTKVTCVLPSSSPVFFFSFEGEVHYSSSLVSVDSSECMLWSKDQSATVDYWTVENDIYLKELLAKLCFVKFVFRNFFSGLEVGSFPNMVCICEIITGKCLQEPYFID